MIRETTSVVPSYKTLNEITGKLNGANKHPAIELKGIFFRREDFESSTKQLMGQLHVEHLLALKFANRGYGTDDFKKEAEKSHIRLHMHSANSNGVSGFDTYDLSPALRHFLNDYCRMLEPIVKLLARKHSGISAQNPRRPTELISFNSYIKKLDGAGIRMPFDYAYFISLYDELWNDYKHAESSGVQAGGWLSDGEHLVSEPKLYVGGLTYFKDMPVEYFIAMSLDNMNALLKHIA